VDPPNISVSSSGAVNSPVGDTLARRPPAGLRKRLTNGCALGPRMPSTQLEVETSNAGRGAIPTRRLNCDSAMSSSDLVETTWAQFTASPSPALFDGVGYVVSDYAEERRRRRHLPCDQAFVDRNPFLRGRSRLIAFDCSVTRTKYGILLHLPSTPMIDREGNVRKDKNGRWKYKPAVEAVDKDAARAFSEAVLELIKERCPEMLQGVLL
jgi:hypothetical protein